MRIETVRPAGWKDPKGYENGVLTIKLPKVEAKKAKRLEVAVGKDLKASSK